MPRFQKRSDNKLKVEGYINEERRVFIVTNYEECIANELLGKIEPKKSDKDYEDVKEMFNKYRPKFNK